MDLHGRQIVGHNTSRQGPAEHQGVNPASGERLPGLFHRTTEDELEEAAELARRATAELRTVSNKDRAIFIEAIAAGIEARTDTLVERCHLESGLPEIRLQAETARTVAQLRMFGKLVREGSWVDARIDRPLPDRAPVPRPDIRRMLIPLGPVAVFCASNFPLAFSTAGVDTASALAAGNPVIVKAHHSHPGTAEITGRTIQAAAAQTGMPDGTFSMLHGPGREVGAALVRHPAVRAVGFTGSQSGGRALFDAAAQRSKPIPVYAEMASINPVFILNSALERRTGAVAQGLYQSVVNGTGQFCTNPGVVILRESSAARAFIGKLTELLARTAMGVMLNEDIARAYRDGIERLDGSNQVSRLVPGIPVDGAGRCHARATVFRTDAKDFLADESLRHEVFGPSTLAVFCQSREEMLAVARSFTGELSSTIHGSDDEIAAHRDLVQILQDRVGRLVFNGFPTGVEVCPAMNHGGPYPATTFAQHTSVGTAAVYRFARPICYQDSPQALLPPELKDDNPRGIWRTVDGELTRKAL